MSDLSDVLNVIAAQCAGFVYPNGTANPPVAAAIVKIYPGWPTASSLDADLQSNIVNVSIYPSGPENNVTRYRPKAQVVGINAPTLTLTQEGNFVTVGGAMPSPFTPHNMAIIVAGQPFIYPVQPTDTLPSIATALASLIGAAYPGTSSGAMVVALPDGVIPSDARVGTTGKVTTEWERQAQRIQITVWAPDPVTRTTISAAIKTAFSRIAFLMMPDGYGARIKAVGTNLSDALEKSKVYRRDLFYEIEYATTITETAATVVALSIPVETQTGAAITTLTE